MDGKVRYSQMVVWVGDYGLVFTLVGVYAHFHFDESGRLKAVVVKKCRDGP